MIPRLLHFLILVFYLNIIAYEPGPASLNGSVSMSDGDSLIEFFLCDILDISGSTAIKNVEVADENYQHVNIVTGISSVLIFFLSFLLYTKSGKVVLSVHPFYRAKSFCLQAYYSYLFRLKPF